MKIIVTGSAGFIGFYLAKELLKKNYSVYGIDNFNDYYSPSLKKERIRILKKYKNFKFKLLDLKNYKKSYSLIKKIKFNCIYHLASQPGIMYSFKNPKTYRSNNIDVTMNLIKICKKIKPEKFYFTSSSSVYGNQKKYPLRENFKLLPINFYAKTKKECEKFLQRQFKNTDIDLKIFRPFTVYGPYARPDMLFISYLKKCEEKSIFSAYHYGEYVRDFTYVEDVAKILCLFLKVPKIKKNIFNICSSKPKKIIQIIKIINKFVKKNCNLSLKPKRKGEMLTTYGDNKYLRKIIKFKKFTPIKIGIKKTVLWFYNYKDKRSFNF